MRSTITHRAWPWREGAHRLGMLLRFLCVSLVPRDESKKPMSECPCRVVIVSATREDTLAMLTRGHCVPGEDMHSDRLQIQHGKSDERVRRTRRSLGKHLSREGNPPVRESGFDQQRGA